MSTEKHDIKKEIKKYLIVFVALLILTIVTVSVSNLQFGVALGIIVALIIASVKGYLVACNFMHLNSEKKLVYFVLILAVICFIAMMLVFVAGHYDLPEGARYVS